ncbi:MAG: AAA family ATPase [Bacteroidaceae bacterium]
MRIEAIRLRNLASIEGTYEIDFRAEPLRSTGIFAISGPTGAGKSTILDALCLALFDKTPRFAVTNEKISLEDVGQERIQQNDVRNILRRGMGEGFAEVDFMGVDDCRYRSHWMVYRARKKSSGSLQNQIMSVTNLTTNTELQGTKKELLAQLVVLVGLTYEQFTRTVLLAQNDFATFLKSRDDAKAELLEKLTGTEVYSRISSLVFQHNREAQQMLTELQTRMGEVHLLTEEELTELQRQRTVNIEGRKRVKTQTEELNWKLKWYEDTAKYTMEKVEAESLLAEANKVLKDASPRFELLKRIDSVQDARGLADNLRNKKITQQTQTTIEQKIKEELSISKLSLAEALTTYKEQERNREICQVEVEEQKPILNKARELDVRLQTANKAVKSADKEQTDCQIQRKNIEKEQAEKIAVLTDKQQNTQLDEWIEKYARHENMINKAGLVIGYLDTMEITQTETKKADEQLLALTEGQRKLIGEREQTQKRLDGEKKKSDEISLASEELVKKIEKINIVALRREETVLKEVKEQTAVVRIAEEAVSLVQTDYKEKQVKQTIVQDEFIRSREALKLQIEELDKTKVEKAAVERLYENAKLMVAESVTKLRANLVEGDACPVCGSTHHPHVEEKKQIDALFHSMENDYQQVNERFQKQNNDWVKLTTNVEYLQLQMNEGEQNLKQLLDSLSQKQTQVKEAEQKLCILLASNALSNKMENTIADRLEVVIGEENAYEELSLSIREKEKQRTNLTLVEEELKIKIQAIEQNCRIVETDIAKQKTIKEFNLAHYQEAFACANKEISIEQWMDLWSNKQVDLKQEIRRLTQLWENKHRTKEEIKAATEKLKTELEGMAKFLVDTIERERKLALLYQQSMDDLNQLKEARSKLLDGAGVDEAEAIVQAKLRKTLEVEAASLKQVNEWKSRCATLEGQYIQTNASIQTLVADIACTDVLLKDWINSYNEANSIVLTSDELRNLLDKDSSWLSEERGILNGLQEKRTSVAAILKERIAQADRHQAILNRPNTETETPELLKNALPTLMEQAEIIEQQLAKVEAELLVQRQNRERLKVFEQELNEKRTVAERWAKLNDLIGQASGEKFKIIAQSYTLNVLLLHANKHLSYLSSRYKLQQVPGTLALQVIDRDICDGVRTVYSLSGGESFLISLALALGLSSLSSNNMKVESLFIDEGFGSLDTESLRAAMEALEQLQTQGRKIGVISHVQEMSERITTQIVLSKQSNGRSKVLIRGGI